MSKREEREQRKREQQEKQRGRQAKAATEPDPQKQPKTELLVDYENATVQWSFELFDHGHDWRQNAAANDHAGFCEIGDQLKSYSQMTWAEIRQNGARDHESEVSQLCRRAQERLAALRLDDHESLWRFRFSGSRRIWGIRAGRIFRVVWWDPDHQVWPVARGG